MGFNWMWGTDDIRDTVMGGKESTFDPMSMYTPGQKKSVTALQDLASTGTGGGITLGQQYGGKLGHYQQTPGELGALSSLQGISGGPDISKARETFADLADTKFDPSDPKSGYAAFSRALAREGIKAEDVMERESAITGSRYGTAIAGEKANLAEKMFDIKASKLAELYQGARKQQLAGAEGLQGLASQEAGLQQIISAQSAMQRQIKDQEAMDQYNEYKRTRNEELSRIGMMEEQWRNPMGPVTTKSKGILGGLLTAAGTAAGAYYGGPAGAQVGAQVGGSLGSLYSGRS